MTQESFNRPGMPLVSIIIPCRNEERFIEACLRSALGQSCPEGGMEVLVADGGSTDGTREIVGRLALEDHRIRTVDNPRGFVSAGMNAAILAAKGRIIVRMDAHTEYAPDYVVECVAVLRRTGADNVGGPARTRADGYLPRAIAAAYHSPFAVGGARFHDTGYEGYLDTVTYGCWPRDGFEKFGLFDEELVRNQDDEHNLRIIRGGGKVYQSPSIRSWYRPRASLGALFRQYMQYGYWKVRVIQKHRIPASLRHLVPGGFVLCLCLSALLASFLPALRVFFLALSGTYLTAVVLASILTAFRGEVRLLPALPLVFACYHFGYGFGFLRGILDFVILRRGAGDSLTRLTRG